VLRHSGAVKRGLVYSISKLLDILPRFGGGFLCVMRGAMSASKLKRQVMRTRARAFYDPATSGSSRANGTSSRPASATQASIAQASLTQSASDAFSTSGRTNAMAASSGGPGGRLASSAGSKPDRGGRGEIARQQANAKNPRQRWGFGLQDGIDQGDADGAAEIAHQVEQPAGIRDFG